MVRTLRFAHPTICAKSSVQIFWPRAIFSSHDLREFNFVIIVTQTIAPLPPTVICLT
jgi:hypothetical protein